MSKRTITSPYHIAILDYIDKHMTRCIETFLVRYSIPAMNNLMKLGFAPGGINKADYLIVDMKRKIYRSYNKPSEHMSEQFRLKGLNEIEFDLNEMVSFLKRELHKYDI